MSLPLARGGHAQADSDSSVSNGEDESLIVPMSTPPDQPEVVVQPDQPLAEPDPERNVEAPMPPQPDASPAQNVEATTSGNATIGPTTAVLPSPTGHTYSVDCASGRDGNDGQTADHA